MLYDNYQKKMNKVASFLQSVRKYRVLIIAIALFLIAVVATMLSIRGIVYEKNDCPESIIYGQPLDYKAGAILTKAEYEFSVKGTEEWSNEWPLPAGEYDVRAVGKTVTGSKRYGKVHSVTVYPKEVEVGVEQSVIYGDNPNLVADLAFEDEIYCTQFIYGNLSSPSTEVTPVKEKIYIFDKYGNPVNSSYKLTVLTGEINFVKRDLTVVVADKTFIYDGTPFTSDEYEVGGGTSLAKGDSIVAKFNDSATEIGTATNTPEIEIKSADGLEVTNNYKINIISGKLTVERRPVKITTGNAKKVYDGTPLICNDYELSKDTPLLQGHTLKLAQSRGITNVGKAGNALTFKIYDNSGKDVSSYYKFNIEEGGLEITARQITVQTESGEWVYDGRAKSIVGFKIVEGSLPQGHEANVVDATSITAVGSTANVLTVRIFSYEGEELTSNFTIDYVEGTLTVTKRALKVTSGDAATLEYSGAPQSYDKISTEGLAQGHSVKATDWATITDIGEIQNSVTLGVVDASGKDVTENYEITYISNTVKVIPRELTVAAGSAEKYYDGTPLTNANGYLAEKLIAGHNIQVNCQGSQTDAGSSSNKIVGSIIITDKDGNDVSENYNVTVEDGVLTVKPRPITITAESKEKIYDGTPLTGNILYPTLVLDHYSQVTNSGSQTDAGSCTHFITSVQILTSSGEDVTKNYAITTVNGTLTVKPRPINIKTGSAEKIYDDTPLTCKTFAVSSEYSPALVLDHYVKAENAIFGSSTSAGVWNNYIDESLVLIKDGDGNEVTQNYAISCEYGTLTIKPRPITVRTGTQDWIYNGEVHSCLDYEIMYVNENSGLVEGHSIKITDFATITNHGSVENALTISIFRPSGSEVTGNYRITFENGTISIRRRTVYIETGSYEWEYDGKEHSYPYYEFVLQDLTEWEWVGLLEGHTLSIGKCVTITEIGEIANYCYDFAVTDVSGNDVSENYSIVVINYGTLSVVPRKVTVITYSYSWRYDGETHMYRAYGATFYTSGLFYTSSGWASIRDVGSVENSMTVKLTLNGVDVTHKFEITYVYGTLTVIDKDSTEIPDSEKEHGGNQGGNGGGNLGGNGGTDSEDGFDGSGNGGEGGSGTGLDKTGNIGGSGAGQGEGKEPVTVLKVKSDLSGQIYLKAKSFGDYNGKSWEEASEYTKLLQGGYGLDYLTGIALQSAGKSSAKVTIENLTADYLLPYYMALGYFDYRVQTSDTNYSGSTSSLYSLYYYLYNYVTEGLIRSNLGEYSAAELAYRQFVYANYLSVPASTKKFMQSIIKEQGFDIKDPTVVAKIAAYIQNSATYNMSYNSELDKVSDIVVSFLRDYKEGVCRHYASAATLLFRTLGIPARYTIGFVGSTSAGEWTEVTSENGHAWVEIYLNGVGWVQIEVTGSGGPAGDDGSGGGSGEGQLVITLKPADRTKQYDGNPLYPEAIEPNFELNGLLLKGYTYEVKFAGSQTNIGTGTSSIASFILRDANGKIDYSVKIKFDTGKLNVVAEQVITIHPYTLQKYYDGTPLYYGADDYYIEGMPAGFRVWFDLSDISLTDIGLINVSKLNLPVYVYDNYGLNVTRDYCVVFDSLSVLEVDKRQITVMSISESKQYDGTALSSDYCWISYGTLAQGHTMEVSVTGSITDVGEAENTISSVKIYDQNGNDVTANYEITKIYGTLAIIE